MKLNLNRIALTHRSALNENKRLISNERLEFLGDAVLELVVSNHLYRHFPQDDEGILSHRRSQIVQTKTLAEAAKSLNLNRQLILSKGEAKSGGRENESILADCFEAVVGAIYLEKGLPAAAEFISRSLLSRKVEVVDYKSELQEKWQKRHHTAPKYKLIKTLGPDHKKTFQVGVYLKHRLVAAGEGLSKQKAEAQAARAALAKLK
ncbi:ribonuclease III [Candidatus Beckwithbacteria bacterium RIFCSPLOWO2_02_FULL_47_23]|uniref:Ribonuclease 3 n=2 Tax=Candidatus Beckwithiibacteriota TaxID=1752726 RepID=A0A1F5E174_9BACT|nr:MAG: ribonuclease III [Candidatus Beckwithbacteria bacterium RIFCSPHIGHO2_12_FULL_47_17]OGD61113.1 MAG: ribonuclease III [Candidatus Beckwithbacteria bacterium RIFCSPLOWO2_02_FULL_47_23]